MQIKAIRNTFLAALAFAILGGLSQVAPAAHARENVQRDSQEVTRLLKEARSQAKLLHAETTELEAYNRSRLSWQTHGTQLETVKQHINAMGRTLSRLEARNPEASPWQQKAITEMRPLLTGLAANAELAISHLRENPRQLTDPAYRETLAEKQSLSAELVETLDDHVDYGETKVRLEELEGKLGSGL